MLLLSSKSLYAYNVLYTQARTGIYYIRGIYLSGPRLIDVIINTWYREGVTFKDALLGVSVFP